MLSELSDEAQHHAERENWGQYRNVRYDTAEYVRERGNWKRAGFLYLEVLIFDLQGVAGAPGVDGFHEAHRTASPAVVKELARFAIEYGLDQDEMRTIYDRVADQTWMDRFPRSEEEVWEEVRDKVKTQKEAIRLTVEVEELGEDELLSTEDATAFVNTKNEYELVRRVETLLENEDPARIPPEKGKRAEMYLAALDPESLSNRWKAKVYRRGGEIMLSRGGEERALQYFERALEAVDQDELGEVKRIVEKLRPRVAVES